MMTTTWGYTLTEADVLPDILSVEEYDTFTSDKYASDYSRSRANIYAAQAAVRNYCGWHVAPSLACRIATNFYDKRLSKNAGYLLIQLPATFVTDVTSVSIGGKEYDTYVFDTNGTLRVHGVDWTGIRPYTLVTVEYIAGVSLDMAAGIRELIAHRVTHAMASTSGVQSESVGGVSVTYNANWTNSARATALADDNKEVLSPYRLRGVF